MAVAFPRLSWWVWGGKDRESPIPATSSLSSSSAEYGYREHDSVKFPQVRESKSRRVKKKWHSREERRVDLKIDREYDLVLVNSDCGCLSGSESDDSDWSVGWLEPHAPDFLSDDDEYDGGEASFAVLVPCYGRGRAEMVNSSTNRVLGAIVSSNFLNELSTGTVLFYFCFCCCSANCSLLSSSSPSWLQILSFHFIWLYA